MTQPQHADADTVVTGGSLPLLLVENNASDIALIRRAFEESDLRVELTDVPTLRQAREALAHQPPRMVLITELLLPDGEGTGLLPGTHTGRPLSHHHPDCQ